jgi:leucyl aminopeptidase
MSARLRIALETEPLERADAEVAVASFFDGERPLRGAASRADWRLCGMISALLAQGRLRGAVGDALLVPTERRLRAPRLVVVGLGPAARFGAPELADAARAIADRLLDLRVGAAALAIPGDWIGAVPVRPAAEACARGALEAVAARGGSLSLGLLVSTANAGRALRGLEALAARARTSGVTLELPDLQPETLDGRPARAEAGVISPSASRP